MAQDYKIFKLYTMEGNFPIDCCLSHSFPAPSGGTTVPIPHKAFQRISVHSCAHFPQMVARYTYDFVPFLTSTLS